MGQLGDTLRERRIALGITLDTAEEATKIRAKLLEALENGEYDKLPNPGYVRGYVTSYARFLELDSVPLLAMYRAETGASRYHDIVPPDTAVAPRHEQHEVPWRVVVIAVAIIAVVSFGIWVAFKLKSGPEKVPPIPTTPSTVSTSTGTPTKQGTTTPVNPAPSTSTKKPAAYTPFSVRVAVQHGGASWITVTVDGKKAYSGTMTGGQSKEFQVTKKATIVVGDPSAVEISRDGKNVDIPDNGGTPTVTLTANPAP